MDHEQEFEERIAESEAEVLDGITRGWTAGFARRENCPVQLTIRMGQSAEELLQVLAEHQPGGEVTACDLAWSVMVKQPARPGLWAESIPLDFGADADNPDFVMAFMVGFSGLSTLEELVEMLSSADAAE